MNWRRRGRKQGDLLRGYLVKPEAVVIGVSHQTFPSFFLLGICYDCTFSLPVRLGVAVRRALVNEVLAEVSFLWQLSEPACDSSCPLAPAWWSRSLPQPRSLSDYGK